MEVPLPGEGSLIVEVAGELDDGVVRPGRVQDIADAASESFESALDRVKLAASIVRDKMNALELAPSEVTVEFAIKLGTAAGWSWQAPAPRRISRCCRAGLGGEPAVRQQARAATVRIWGQGHAIVGVGFLVGERQVVTCAHVVAHALGLPDNTRKPENARLAIDFPLLGGDAGRYAGSVVAWQSVRAGGGGDIAGLLLDRDPPAGAAPATLVTRDDLWGRRLRAFGFPGRGTGGDWASGVLRDTQAEGWLRIKDDKHTGRRVQPGYSGAPVWVEDDLHGVVGMVVAADSGPSDRVAYAIPASLLATMFDTAPLPPCPYRDLLAFRPEDAELFFGREEEVVARLTDAASRQPLVRCSGRRGVGSPRSSSPALSPGSGSGRWSITQFRPGNDPFRALAVNLVPALDPHLTAADRLLEVPKLAHVLRQGRLDEVVGELRSRTGDRHALIVADQFEELYALCPDEQDRRKFLDGLQGGRPGWQDP